MFRGRSKGERARREQARCLANMAHIRQSKPDSGLGYQVKLLILFQVVPSSLESGYRDRLDKKTGTHAGSVQLKGVKALVGVHHLPRK